MQPVKPVVASYGLAKTATLIILSRRRRRLLPCVCMLLRPVADADDDAARVVSQTLCADVHRGEAKGRIV